MRILLNEAYKQMAELKEELEAAKIYIAELEEMDRNDEDDIIAQ